MSRTRSASIVIFLLLLIIGTYIVLEFYQHRVEIVKSEIVKNDRPAIEKMNHVIKFNLSIPH